VPQSTTLPRARQYKIKRFPPHYEAEWVCGVQLGTRCEVSGSDSHSDRRHPWIQTGRAERVRTQWIGEMVTVIHSAKYGLLGCNAVHFREDQTFRKNISPLSSESESKASRQNSVRRLLLLVSCLAYSSTLKTEICSSETSGFVPKKWRYNPEDRVRYSDRWEKFKFQYVRSVRSKMLLLFRKLIVARWHIVLRTSKTRWGNEIVAMENEKLTIISKFRLVVTVQTFVFQKFVTMVY
jgi:hypothetical protein